MNKLRLIILKIMFFTLAFTTAYFLFRVPLIFSDNPEYVKKRVLYRIPIGTSVSKAQNKMESYGFTCTREEDVPIDYEPTVYGNTLYCDWSIGFLLIGKQWKVIFIYEKEAVKNIIASVREIYP